MEDAISPVRLKTFARHLVHAARKQEARKDHLAEVSAHLERITKYARNPRIRKETLREEVRGLRGKIAHLMQRQDPLTIPTTAEERYQQRVGEVETHLTQVDQRLLLDEQRRNAQLSMLVERLDGITDTMGALCKRLHVAPPPIAKPAHAVSRKRTDSRDAHGRFLKRKLPPTQAVLSPTAFTVQKTVSKRPQLLIHSWTHKRQIELQTVRKKLSGLQLQYSNLKRHGKHDPKALAALGKLITKLKERLTVLAE